MTDQTTDPFAGPSQTSKSVYGMHAEKVISGETDTDTQALRMWVWFAVKQAGGKITVTYDEFFTCQGEATLYWSIDPTSLALTIVAE